MDNYRKLIEDSLRLAGSGERANALAYLKRGIRTARRSSGERWLALLYKNAGAISEQEGDLVGAKKYYKRSLAIKADRYLYFSLASVAHRLGQKRSAKLYRSLCLEAAAKAGDSDLTKMANQLP